MSVYKNDYVMICVDIQEKVIKHEQNDEDDGEKYLEDLENICKINNLDYVFDYMSGEYYYIGKILAKSNEDDGFKLTTLNINIIEKYKNEIKEKLKQINFNIKDDYDDLIQLKIFSHYY